MPARVVRGGPGHATRADSVARVGAEALDSGVEIPGVLVELVGGGGRFFHHGRILLGHTVQLADARVDLGEAGRLFRRCAPRYG